ncbi:MAG: acyl-CoA thioesterase [Planctomycetota bacterium]|jgi:acyl-CoA thioester hydrolase
MTPSKTNTTRLRVRYSETDQMGTFYNSRALEWFECGRTELLRQLGVPYREMESRGVMLPLVESHVAYLGRACYDDELELQTAAEMTGKARVRFDVQITNVATDQPVARGWTVHAIVSADGRPVRPPQWFIDAVNGQ